ncbi:MAG: hypothetical protein U5L09_16435 [Bacteroidales bacterium]|nr:hypothetical protein [Bacteroidales bacterium]
MLAGADATHYNSVTWQSSGDGSFNSVAASPRIHAGSGGCGNGQVALTMTANGVDGDRVTDETPIYLACRDTPKRKVLRMRQDLCRRFAGYKWCGSGRLLRLAMEHQRRWCVQRCCCCRAGLLSWRRRCS